MPPTHDTPPHVRRRAWKRHQRLVALGYADYNAYTRSSAWQAMKRRYIEQHPWICNLCGATENLELHHRTYDRVGEERLEDLMPLCDGCHSTVHTLERRGHANLNFDGIIDKARALRNRADAAARKQTADDEQAAFSEQNKAALEALPIDERIRRALLAASVADRAAISNHLHVLKLKARRRKPITRDFVLRRVRAIEQIAYRF